eukprot:NODE_60_length_27201_cov_1.043318.p13 type:complete len:319 gc:universal NODE_60_length_27201_cov_1.043318:11767-12723(+)
MINPQKLQQAAALKNHASASAIDIYQARKGKIPFNVQDKAIFEQVFNEFKHQDFSCFKSFLNQLRNSSLAFRTEIGSSDVVIRGFQSILKKHVDFWTEKKFNFDLLLDTIDVLSVLKVTPELALKYDIGKAIKNVITRSAKGLDPNFPSLAHAKKSYNQLKVNWKNFMSEDKNDNKRKSSTESSAAKKPKVVAGPWTIKATEDVEEDLDQMEEDDDDDYLMAPILPLNNMKSFPKGVLKSAMKRKDPEGDEQMEDVPSKKKVFFDMKMNAIKRIDKIARRDTRTLYSERGEASRALKQKDRMEWRSPRGISFLFRIGF